MNPSVRDRQHFIDIYRLQNDLQNRDKRSCLNPSRPPALCPCLQIYRLDIYRIDYRIDLQITEYIYRMITEYIYRMITEQIYRMITEQIYRMITEQIYRIETNAVV